jgi:Inner membrane protein YgaP-like, transmembrane domain
MITNVGTIDRILRVSIGLVLIAFALGFIATGSPYAWVGWIGVIPLLTALVGSCPLYSIVGLSTCPVDKRA